LKLTQTWQRAKRSLPAMIVLASFLTLTMAGTATAGAMSRPVVVELYTSEGCSSCPPAEKLLEELAKRTDVLALAFHVDYWDDLGWRDHFSMQEATQRQQEAARTLKLKTVGTPQFIVDGRTALWGTGRESLEQALKARRPDVAVEMTRTDSNLIVRAEAPGSAERYDVYVVGYLPEAVTAIGRGENAGRTLREVNAVRYIRKIGSSGDATREWSFPFDKLPKDAERIAVLLQSPTTGAIVGARSVARNSLTP